VSKNSEELKKIRTELQWLSWGLVKIPLIAIAIASVIYLITLSVGKDEEPDETGPATSLERVCNETEDGRLAIEVGERTLFLDNVPAYQKLSAREKWEFWDEDSDGFASEEEIESGISKLGDAGSE
jgi:hypothetical protein